MWMCTWPEIYVGPSSSWSGMLATGNESDSDVRRVPEMSIKGGGSGAGSSHAQDKSSAGPPQRKRGGASADKEHKRLKRFFYRSLLEVVNSRILNLVWFPGFSRADNINH